jgi:calcineurin-like phosphoesterase family protein
MTVDLALNNVFFTSDEHFYHEAMITKHNRNFPDIHNMNQYIIDSWNLVVTNKDDVFVLGDFSFGNRKQNEQIFSKLNGRKHLIIGNHDDNRVKKLSWTSVDKWTTLKVLDHERGIVQKIFLCHFPVLSAPVYEFGWVLHGHAHGDLTPSKTVHKMKDVGVDTNNYLPYSYLNIKEIFKP